jgi:hypothetical protein
MGWPTIRSFKNKALVLRYVSTAVLFIFWNRYKQNYFSSRLIIDVIEYFKRRIIK